MVTSSKCSTQSTSAASYRRWEKIVKSYTSMDKMTTKTRTMQVTRIVPQQATALTTMQKVTTKRRTTMKITQSRHNESR